MDYISPRDDPELQADKLGSYYLGDHRADNTEPQPPKPLPARVLRLSQQRRKAPGTDGHRVSMDLAAIEAQAEPPVTPEERRTIYAKGAAMARHAMADLAVQRIVDRTTADEPLPEQSLDPQKDKRQTETMINARLRTFFEKPR